MFTLRTIEDAIDKADNPENVFFGIFNQKTTDQEFEDFSQYSNVRLVNAHCDIPLGLGIARLNASLLHDSEEYFLQADAHNLFVKSWDTILVNDHRELVSLGVDKPIISQSVQWHSIDAYLSHDYQDNLMSTKANPLYIDKNGNTTEMRDITTIPEGRLISDKFIEHYGVMGPFMFASSSFIYEVSYDFRVNLIAEQESISMRSSTRGYRIFSNGKTVVSTLTKLKPAADSLMFDENSFGNDHHMNHIDGRKEKYPVLNRHTHKENSFYEYLRGNALGWFGSPTKELHQKYIDESGFDFSNARIFEDGQKEQLENYWFNSVF